jgi:hypothetical protein
MENIGLKDFLKRENIGASVGLSSYVHNGTLSFDMIFGHRLILFMNRIQRIHKIDI